MPKSQYRVYDPPGQGRRRLLAWLQEHPWSSASALSVVFGRHVGGLLSRAEMRGLVDRRPLLRADGVRCLHYAIKGTVTGDDAIDRAMRRDRELAAMGEYAIREAMDRAVTRRLQKRTRTCA